MCLPCFAWATHNRAGEITYEQIGDLRIRATIITYTKASSIDADRDTLILEWGDGTFSKVGRNNGNGKGIIIGPDIRYNIYTFEHTYPSRGSYTMSMTDPNRNSGILNVNPPNSENIPFYIETTFSFLNSTFQGFNNAPKLLQPPIDVGCVGQLFTHNPNAYDIDGDSLVYELIVPQQGVGSNVPNYVFPDQIIPGVNNILTLNTITGDLIWNTPKKGGEYNIALRINEYRDGILISSLVRDMQILIQVCDNRPPKVETIEELCIVVGQSINFNVTATDPDAPPQKVKLTALGGPLVINGAKANFNVSPNFENPPVNGTFTWTPDCNAINREYYSVIFKAVDNKSDTTGLADLKTVRIKVVGPSPENLTGESIFNQILLKWDDPYLCQTTANEYFQGFNVWRRISSNSFQPDTCNPTMEGKGYTKIAFSQKTTDGQNYTYLDKNVEKGKAYCYRVEAEFAQTSPGGFPYNQVQSLPSNEICVQLNLDIPLITKASVEETSINGSILVQWVKPRTMDLDTIANPGPYTYVLKRGSGFNPTMYVNVPGASFTSLNFLDPVDTSFLDIGINTIASPYSYVVDFFVSPANTIYGSSTSASSVFLNVTGSDKKTILTWNENVPWSNNSFTIYKQNILGNFDSIGITQARIYEDKNLENGTEYCYKIRTTGTYGIVGIPNPIINFSQESCAVPVDTVPPCAPMLVIVNDCDNGNSSAEIKNNLSWNNPDDQCGTPNDTKGYRVYVLQNGQTVPELIFETNNENQLTFSYVSETYGLAGCYYVVAFDSVFNESIASNIVCIENCPDYRLPNAFSPNGDGYNDTYKPYPYRFVNKVEFIVYNRWGNVIFETANPDLLWEGTSLSGSTVPDGVYYYTCRVFQQISSTGIIQSPIVLTGFIELIRS